MTPQLTLISHPLCPYVQRAAIVMLEKGLDFERITIDLAHKPDWFLALSPLGKTPVLVVNEVAIFESAVICEYLDETYGARLHPQDSLQRAIHRGWMEFGSALLNQIAAFYNAPHELALQQKAQEIHSRLRSLETVLTQGPYFCGADFCMVDAVFGPIFRYFAVFAALSDFDFLQGLPQLQAWQHALAARPSIQQAADPRYTPLLTEFLKQRQSALGQRLAA